MDKVEVFLTTPKFTKQVVKLILDCFKLSFAM